MIESREGCGPLELTRRRRGQIPLRTTLSQIPLKSFGFPGAESARKRFFLRGQAPLRKNQRLGATNRNLRFRLVGREATCLPFGQATFPPRRSPASIGSREGSHPLELSHGLFWWRNWFPTKQAILLKDFVSDDAGVGRSAPLPPSGDGRREGCDPLALSRSCSDGDFGFRRSRLFFCGRCFRRNGRGALCSPAPPRATGCERVATLSRSPGAVLTKA